MKQILKPSKTAMSVCGEQKRNADKAYRLTKHCLRVPCADGTLLYNTMSCGMYLLENGEDMLAQEALYSEWFLVPEEHDETKQVRDLRKLGAAILPKKRKSSFSILTTTDCNARCFYCYEMGCTRTPMSEQTARDAAEYIARQCGGERVSLHWFGGEPLYNKRPIEIICGALREKGIAFTSSIITNGYYLDAETARAAAREWNMKWAQITLDGTEAVYNRTKAYVDGEGSAFERVIGNIEHALDEGITVKVRLNMDAGNAQDLLALAEQLGKRPGPRKGFGVYAALLEGFKGEIHGFETVEQASAAAIALEDRLEALGIHWRKGLYREFRMNNCMADSDASEQIMPDGRLTRCEHFNENDTYGSIYGEERDEAYLKSWKEWEYYPECGDCVMYPLCFNLKRCEWTKNGCQKAARPQTIRNMEREMALLYEEWKEGKTE